MGLEPTSPDWQSSILAAVRPSHGRRNWNRTSAESFKDSRSTINQSAYQKIIGTGALLHQGLTQMTRAPLGLRIATTTSSLPIGVDLHSDHTHPHLAARRGYDPRTVESESTVIPISPTSKTLAP